MHIADDSKLQRSWSFTNRENANRKLGRFWMPAILFGTLAFLSSFSSEIAKSGFGGKQFAESAERQSSQSVQSLLTLAYGVVGCGMLFQQKKKHQSAYLPIVFLVACLVTYIFAGIFWSDDPNRTMRKGILILCIIVGGMGIGKAWSFVQICHAIIGCSTISLLIGIVNEIYFGNFLSSVDDYRFSGVFHPNAQAFNCGLLIIACSSMYHVSGRKYYLLLAAIVACFLILTKGRTATAGVFIATAWLWWQYFNFRVSIVLTLLGGFALPLLLFAFALSSNSLDAIGTVGRMGREDESADPTQLTGRLNIWQIALADFTKRPILGHGFGGYWVPRRMESYERFTGWSFDHSHSVYIETLVDLGVLGASIGFLLVTVAVFRALELRNTAAGNGGRFVVTIAIFAAVTGFSETAFIGQGYPAMVAAICIGYIAAQGTIRRTRYAKQVRR